MNKTPKTWLIVLFAVASVTLLIYQLMPARMKVNLEPYKGIGDVLAEQALQLAGKTGEVVVLTWSGDVMERGTHKSTLQALMRRLKQEGVRVVASETIPVPPMAPDQEDFYVPGEQAMDLAAIYPGADVIISIAGPPEMTKRSGSAFPRKPAWIVISALPCPSLVEGFLSGVVASAVVPRVDSVTTQQKSVSERDWFDTYYQVVTAADLSKLGTVAARDRF